jgi:hypothetical protein
MRKFSKIAAVTYKKNWIPILKDNQDSSVATYFSVMCSQNTPRGDMNTYHGDNIAAQTGHAASVHGRAGDRAVR